MLPSATAASASAETRPIMTVSTTPIAIRPSWTNTTGAASVARSLRSSRVGCSLMRLRNGRRPGSRRSRDRGRSLEQVLELAPGDEVDLFGPQVDRVPVVGEDPRAVEAGLEPVVPAVIAQVHAPVVVFVDQGRDGIPEPLEWDVDRRIAREEY